MAFKRNQVNKRVFIDLKKRSSAGILFYLITSCIIVFVSRFHERHLFIALFFLLSIGSVSLFRLIHSFIVRKMGEHYEPLNQKILFASIIVGCLLWSTAYSLIMLQKNEFAVQILMTVCICGLAAGGVVAFTPLRWLSVGFNVSMLLPASFTILLTGLNIPLAMLIFAYSAYMIFITDRGNEEYWNALENEYLLEIKSQELALLSNTDVLTGLYNRRYFEQAFDMEWKRSGRNNNMLSAILFDIDHFKNINDTFGHQAGDEYLKQIAKTLTSVFKRDYDVVARYGGEEFIVLLPGIHADCARQLAEEVRQKIESLVVDLQGQTLRTTISSGIMSCVPDFQARPESFMSCADKALYQAKQMGRNRVVVYNAMSSCRNAS